MQGRCCDARPIDEGSTVFIFPYFSPFTCVGPFKGAQCKYIALAEETVSDEVFGVVDSHEDVGSVAAGEEKEEEEYEDEEVEEEPLSAFDDALRDDDLPAAPNGLKPLPREDGGEVNVDEGVLGMDVARARSRSRDVVASGGGRGRGTNDLSLRRVSRGGRGGRTAASPTSNRRWDGLGDGGSERLVVSEDMETLDVGAALDQKPLECGIEGTLVAHRDSTPHQGGHRQHTVLIAGGTSAAKILGWRDVAEALALDAENAVNSRVVCRPCKFKVFRGVPQFDLGAGGRLELVSSVAAPYVFPFHALGTLPELPDYTEVHLEERIASRTKAVATTQGRLRAEVRIWTLSTQEYVDCTVWGDHAGRDYPVGAKFRLFFGSLNLERRCVDVSDGPGGATVEIENQEGARPPRTLRALSWPSVQRKRKIP